MIKEIIVCHSNPVTAFNNTHLLEMHTLRKQTKDEGENEYRLLLTNSSNPNVTGSESESNTMSSDSQYGYSANKTLFEQLVQLKMKHINATDENELYGVALRFYFCSNRTQMGASNEWVIHVDDDMDINSIAIDQLILNMAINPKRIVGFYGRKLNYLDKPYLYGYNHLSNSKQDVTAEVVLTKILILERVLCTEFFNYKHLVEQNPPKVSQYKPIKWNGEDIFLNLVANRYYNVPPYGPYQNYLIQMNKTRINKQTGAYAGEIDESDDFISAISSFIVTHKEKYPYLYNFVTHQQFYQQQGKLAYSSSSISGDVEKVKDKTMIGYMISYLPALMKSTLHRRYRGKLWYVAKQRLMKHYNASTTTATTSA
jgi:Glycosyl transferase family 64 domain